MTEDETVGWHHRLDGHEFGWTPGFGDGQGGLECCGEWGHKESDTTEQLIWTELYIFKYTTWDIYTHTCKNIITVISINLKSIHCPCVTLIPSPFPGNCWSTFCRYTLVCIFFKFMETESYVLFFVWLLSLNYFEIHSFIARSSFLFEYFIVWIYHHLCSYSPVHRNLGYFQFWTFINNAVMNICVWVFEWTVFFVLGTSKTLEENRKKVFVILNLKF